MTATIKAKVKTEHITAEIAGPLNGAIGTIFMMVASSSDRERILEKLKKIHEEMVKGAAEGMIEDAAK